MKQAAYKAFARLARTGNIVPLVRRIPADLLTPVSAYLRLARPGAPSFLLESIEGGESIARYSFMGVGPFRELKYRAGMVEILEGGRRATRAADLFRELRSLTGEYRSAALPGLPPFTSGAVGYFAYDIVRQLERMPSVSAVGMDMPEAHLLFFADIVAFDHVRHQILLMANVFCGGKKNLQRLYRQAVKRLDAMEESLRRPLKKPREKKKVRQRAGKLKVKSNFRKPDFLAAVRRAKRAIRKGDVYQLVLSQRLEVPVTAAPFTLYRALRMVNPSPYMYFLNLGKEQIAGASPEMLVKVQGRTVHYRPIAGTRPRGATEEQDRRYQQQLRASVKERAEHVMLVDLGRNDLGRVSDYGTVKVDELMVVERYSHVMHLVSSLRGRLRRKLDCFDALAACFPAGTVTGAPKVSAMKMIEEMEPNRRGVYAGAVGYLDFSGNLDTCIAIRTMVVKDGKAYVQAGAGIVADSNPEKEYQETLSKAQALLAAIELAEGGLD